MGEAGQSPENWEDLNKMLSEGASVEEMLGLETSDNKQLARDQSREAGSVEVTIKGEEEKFDLIYPSFAESGEFDEMISEAGEEENDVKFVTDPLELDVCPIRAVWEEATSGLLEAVQSSAGGLLEAVQSSAGGTSKECVTEPTSKPDSLLEAVQSSAGGTSKECVTEPTSKPDS